MITSKRDLMDHIIRYAREFECCPLCQNTDLDSEHFCKACKEWYWNANGQHECIAIIVRQLKGNQEFKDYVKEIVKEVFDD